MPITFPIVEIHFTFLHCIAQKCNSLKTNAFTVPNCLAIQLMCVMLHDVMQIINKKHLFFQRFMQFISASSSDSINVQLQAFLAVSFNSSLSNPFLIPVPLVLHFSFQVFQQSSVLQLIQMSAFPSMHSRCQHPHCIFSSKCQLV